MGNPDLWNNDCEELQAKIDGNNLVSVYYGDQSDKLWTEYDDLFDPDGSIKFFYNTNPECASQQGVKHPKIVFYRNFESKINIYDGPSDS